MDVEAVGGEDEAVAFAGLGFADVDVAGKRAGQGRAVERDGADLGVFGALRFFLGPEARFGV